MKRLAIILLFVSLVATVILRWAGMTLFHAAHLWWIGFILSAGVPCAVAAWKTYQLRKRHRIFHYFGLVKAALLIAILNNSYTIYRLIKMQGMAMFDTLSLATYRSLICQTLIAIALWALMLYLFGRVNGNTYDTAN